MRDTLSGNKKHPSERVIDPGLPPTLGRFDSYDDRRSFQRFVISQRGIAQWGYLKLGGVIPAK
jgi:hypothetical protein